MLQRPRRKVDIERKIILEEAQEDLITRRPGHQPRPVDGRTAVVRPPLEPADHRHHRFHRGYRCARLQEHHRRYHTPANAVIAPGWRIERGAALAAGTGKLRSLAGRSRAPDQRPATGPSSRWVQEADLQLSLQLVFRAPAGAIRTPRRCACCDAPSGRRRHPVDAAPAENLGLT
ncbi:MAG: hypothetical protein R2864_03185 [Syntrophotaleaceae bacterium]